MKTRTLLALIALCACLLNSCRSPAPAPPVNSSLVQAGVRQKASAPTLAAGRSLFLSRCVRCHALPNVSRFSAPRLTAIVGIMSRRARMGPKQHDALLKYLLTVRSLRD